MTSPSFAASNSWRIATVTTDKLENYLNFQFGKALDPEQLVHVQHMGGRDWVLVISPNKELMSRPVPAPLQIVHTLEDVAKLPGDSVLQIRDQLWVKIYGGKGIHPNGFVRYPGGDRLVVTPTELPAKVLRWGRGE